MLYQCKNITLTYNEVVGYNCNSTAIYSFFQQTAIKELYYCSNFSLNDPALGRMLSPDNYITDPRNPQAYNRYSYCINNPLKYTDPTGEWFVIDDLIAAGIGGLINLGVNAFNGNLSGMGFWETLGKGAAAFGAGAASGTLALYGPVGWAAGGAIVGGTNAWLGGATGWDIAKGAGVGVVSGFAGGAVGTWAASSISPLLNGIGSPVLKGAITGVVGGAAGGYTGGFAGGLIMTGDFNAAHHSGMSGMWMGAGIGWAAGAGYGYKYAVENNINLWTGKPNAIETPYQTPQQKAQEGVNRAIQEIEAQGGTVLIREVTLEVNGVRVRVDLAADFNGQITLIEVKNGPSAGFTPNQNIVYPKMIDGIPIVPRGANAVPVWGPGQIGQPTTIYILKIIKY